MTMHAPVDSQLLRTAPRPLGATAGRVRVPAAFLAYGAVGLVWIATYLARQVAFVPGAAPSWVGDFALEGILLALTLLAGIVALAFLAAAQDPARQ